MEKIVSKWLCGILLVLSFSISAQETEKATKKSLTSGFNHIGLTVTQLDESVNFFVDALG